MVGYKFEGQTRFDKLFAGIAGSAPRHVDRLDRTGTEHIGPEDTFEGDYGRLLDRFHKNNAEGMASPTGTADGWQLPVEGFSDLSDAA